MNRVVRTVELFAAAVPFAPIGLVAHAAGGRGVSDNPKSRVLAHHGYSNPRAPLLGGR